MAKVNRQRIGCKVGSCMHNDSNSRCNLSSIEVEPMNGAQSGTPEDESMCGSYKCQNK